MNAKPVLQTGTVGLARLVLCKALRAGSDGSEGGSVCDTASLPAVHGEQTREGFLMF